MQAQLDQDEMDAYYQEFQVIMKNAVANNARYSQNAAAIFDDGYRLAYDKPNFKSFRRPHPLSKHDDFLMMGVVNANLDDLGYALYSDNSQDTKIICSLLHGCDFIDGEVIQNHLVKDDEDPYRYFGIKHLTMQFLSSSLFKPRELLYIENMGSTVNEDGHRVIYTVLRSIRFPEFTPVPGTVRADFQMVSLYVGLPTGQVQYYTTHLFNPNGKFPAFLYNQRSARNYQTAQTFGQLGQIRRLIAAPAIEPLSGVVSALQKCVVCSTVSKKWRWCRTCGQITCKSCAYHIAKPGHMIRSSKPRSSSVLSMSSASKLSTSSSSRHKAESVDTSIVQEDYCKKCFYRAKNPQAFQPQGSLSSDFAVSHVRERERSLTTPTTVPTLRTKKRTESEESHTTTSSTPNARPTPKGVTLLPTEFHNPRNHQHKFERAASDGKLLSRGRSSHSSPESTKLRTLEEATVEFNPDLFESLEYQRKLLADMQALMGVSQSSSSAAVA
ncbi:unnamed protein product [Aphanomyces euteiches]|uniref:FYVE-type domain-containing protein n=1 Tax=Aphanomyces euteiches TaxID=100861 RepID=A0A6G0XQL1_9STRA|nr:hypothetical protein Ae201684_002495 [Aphanomyces euteiches]KAH9093342.1 hypothetical protein Ae201684P_008997 [Aphanomyces euteiches]KAH9144350.1 hypothetical protein AeRB84_011699 [Aphanomyces euteiches]